MSGPAVEALVLEGGLSALTSQLTKLKGLKTKKLNGWRRTLERFQDDQDNLELWTAVQLHKEVASDYGTAYELLIEACMAKMREEVDKSKEDTVSPWVAKLTVAESELGDYTADKENLETSFYKLAGSFRDRQRANNSLETEKSRTECKPDTSQKVKSAEAIKPDKASLKLSPTEFRIWSAKASGWVKQSNFLLAEVDVQHLYVNAIIDKDIQLKIEALPEYAESDALQMLDLVERVHDAANPLFVKRSNFYAAKRSGGEAESTYLARVRVLSDLAKIDDMNGAEHIKFKVLTDLRMKTREKILRKPDITLDEMTVLIAELEAMDIVNNTLKLDTPKVPHGDGKKKKEDAMQAQTGMKQTDMKQGKKKKVEAPRRRLPDEAYRMGCWICGADHRRENCDADRSTMKCNICSMEKNHVTSVCLQQFADSTASGQPPGRPSTPVRLGWW